jgi:hypothetical protein
MLGEEKEIASVVSLIALLFTAGLAALPLGEAFAVVLVVASAATLHLFRDFILGVFHLDEGHGVQRAVQHFMVNVLDRFNHSQNHVTLGSGKEVCNVAEIYGSDVSGNDLFETRSVIPSSTVLRLLCRSAFALVIIVILGLVSGVSFPHSGAAAFVGAGAVIWLSLVVFTLVYWVSYARYALYQYSREGFARYMNTAKVPPGWHGEVLRIACEAGWVKGTRVRATLGVSNDRRRPGAPRVDM